jgi:hypothetical protein
MRQRRQRERVEVTAVQIVEMKEIRASDTLVPHERMTSLQLTVEQSAIPALHHTPGIGFSQKLHGVFGRPHPAPDKKRTAMA